MQEADSLQFRNLMRGMCKLYSQEPDALLLDIYWLALKSWSIEDFEQAAAHLMSTAQFMPRPADFTALRKAGRPTSGEAWIKAMGNSRSAIVCGQVTRGTSCGDPLIDRAVHAIGGYGILAMCESDKLCFLEKRFCEHFESMQESDDTREAVPQIASTFRPRLNGEGPKSIRDLLPTVRPDNNS